MDDPGARRKAKAVSKASASTAEASTQDSYGGDDLGRADAYDNSPAWVINGLCVEYQWSNNAASLLHLQVSAIHDRSIWVYQKARTDFGLKDFRFDIRLNN